MSNFYINNTQLLSQLTKKYFDLSPAIQKIVQLFSVIYTPIDKNSFISCLSETAALDENNKPWNTKTLSLEIDKLIKAGLLVKESKSSPECHPLLTEIATRHAVETGKFDILVKAVDEKLPVSSYGSVRIFRNLSQCIREIRIGLYRKDLSFINKQIENYYKHCNSKEKIVIENIFEQICNNPFDEHWFSTLPQELFILCISSIFQISLLKLSDSEEALMLLADKCDEPEKYISDYLHLMLAEQYLLRGDTEDAQDSLQDISEESENQADIGWGWSSFLKGENEKAIKYYTDALKSLKKSTGKRQIYFNSIAGLFFILALLKDGSPERIKEAEDYTNIMIRQSDHFLNSVYMRLKIILQVQQGDITQKELIVNASIPPVEKENSLETLFLSLCLYWMDMDSAKRRLPDLLEPLYRRSLASGHHWLAMETAELLSRLKPSSNYQQQAQALREDNEVETIID
ncbi:tetratricopeptide repeat protein, partial [Sphaerospermopsis reniformis]